MSALDGIPKPGTAEFNDLVPGQVQRAQATALLRHRNGLTLPELERSPECAMYRGQVHFSRRLRDLDKVFEMVRLREGRVVRYRIMGLRTQRAETARISPRVRARVLFRDGSRCQMCGANPARDADVQLEVDHKRPLDLGGSNDEDNLWTLCRVCNQGKRAFFNSVQEHRHKIADAIGHAEVHRRLGEALRAFGVGTEVPSWVLELVASPPGNFNEDWQRRLRELRDLGWDYTVTKRRENGRVVSFYTLTTDGGWPAGPIRAAIGSGR